MRIAVWVVLGCAPLAHARDVVVTSPNKQVELVIGVDGARLVHSARLSGNPVIESSPLGLEVDGQDLGVGATLGGLERFTTNQRFAWRGVHAEAVDRSNGARLSLKSAQGAPFSVEARAFDDAVAFRFIVPGTGARVPDATTSFRIPAGSTVWYHGARDHYEGLYSRKPIEDATEGDWAGPPLTFRLPGGKGYASISEAALIDYAGMMLQADGRSGFRERLGHAVPASYPYTLRYGEDNAKRLSVPAPVLGDITTPWRVVLIGTDLNALVNSDAIAAIAAA